MTDVQVVPDYQSTFAIFSRELASQALETEIHLVHVQTILKINVNYNAQCKLQLSMQITMINVNHNAQCKLQ